MWSLAFIKRETALGRFVLESSHMQILRLLKTITPRFVGKCFRWFNGFAVDLAREGGREGGSGSAPLTQAFRRISKPQFSRRHLSADDLLQSSLNSQEGPTLVSRKQHGLSTAESSILQSTTEKSCVHGVYILKLRRCSLKIL